MRALPARAYAVPEYGESGRIAGHRRRRCGAVRRRLEKP
jgi:hypothetical protein